MADGVDNVDDLEAEVDPVHLLHLLDQISNLPLDLELPIAVARCRNPGQAGNVDPVLIGAILDPVGKLGINSGLERVVHLQSIVVMLQIGKPVTMSSGQLLNCHQLLSPKMENTKSCDILPLKLTKLTRTIGKKSWHQGKTDTCLSKDNYYALEVRADPKNHFNNHPYLQVNNVIQKVLKRVVIKIKNSK